ncbi:MAG: hypothetical protein PHY40_03785 [Patescibacteria group bacterium]|nr:hypothetical protein [Patescibacteria group bacterium]
MNDVFKAGKKVFTVGVVFATILWSVGVAALVPAVAVAEGVCPTLVAGDMIKVTGKPAIYAVDNNLKVLYFPSGDEFKSWRPNETYGGYISITQECYDSLPVPSAYPGAVNFRPGSYIVKRPSSDQLYVVEPNNTLAKITVEAAKALYGTNYKVMTVADAFWPHYIHQPSNGNGGADVTSAVAHPGMLVKVNNVNYYVDSDSKLREVSDTGFTANNFKTKFVRSLAASVIEGITAGEKIEAEVSGVADKTQSGVVSTTTTTTTTTVSTGSLSISLAADTPASSSMIVSDLASDNSDSAGRVALAKFNFTANSGAVIVNSIKLKQTGISANNDISNLYLYDGDTFIAQHNALSEKVFTFNKSAGLFTVGSGQTKTITVKADMADNLDSGKSIGMQIVASSDVLIDGSGTVSLNGTVAGNLMTYVAVTDNGYAQITNIAPSADNTVNPGTNDFSVWSFQIQGGDQILKLNRIKLSQAGSIANADLANFKLYEGGVQIGSTLAALATDNSLEFKDLNFEIGKGVAKTIELRCDVVSGSSRNFRFMIQNIYDIDIIDASYGNMVQADNATEASWSVRYQGDASTVETTINSGTLTVTLSPTTPTGNVAQGATQVEIAKYDFKATGEDVRVDSIYFATNSTGNEVGLDNVAFFVDGSQIGVTDDLDADSDAEGAIAQQWTFGSSFIVPASQTKTLVVKADMKNAAGTNMTSGSVITPTLNSTAGAATTLTTLSSLTTFGSSLAASALTVTSGAVSVAKNNSLPDGSATNVNGVANEADVHIGSFTVTAGAAEAITVSQFVIADTTTGATNEIGDQFTSMYAKFDGTKVGDTQTSLTADDSDDATYTINVSPAVSIPAGNSKVIDVYGQVKSGGSITTAEVMVKLSSMTYYKTISKTSATWTTIQNGQKVYIAANGTLSAVAASDNPTGQIVTMGTADTDRTSLAKFSLTASIEDIKVESIIIFDTMNTSQGTVPDNATSTLTNFGLYVDGATTPLNGLEVNLTATNTPAANSAYAVFNLSPNLVIPKGTTKNLLVKAKPNTYLNASAGVTHKIYLESDAQSLNNQTGSILARGSKSNTAINKPAADVNANEMVIYRTKPTVTKGTNISSKLSGGELTLADFTITASPAQASLKKLTFTASIVDTTTTSGILSFDDFKLYKDGSLMTAGSEVYIFDGSGTASADQLDTAGTGLVNTDSFDLGISATNIATSGTSTFVVVFGTEVKVPTTGVNFLLKANVTNVSTVAADGDSISVSLANDDSLNGGGDDVGTAYSMYYLDNLPAAYYGGSYGIGLNTAASGGGTAHDGNFLWSDESSGVDHAYSTMSGSAGSVVTAYASSQSQDWTSGYRVGGLNSGITWSFSK